MQNRELEIKLELVLERLDLAEMEIIRLKNPIDRSWLSPADIEKYSQGKYPARIVRDTIQQSIDHPADSLLQVGVHYTINISGDRRMILVDYPEFDRLMILKMREIAFA